MKLGQAQCENPDNQVDGAGLSDAAESAPRAASMVRSSAEVAADLADAGGRVELVARSRPMTTHDWNACYACGDLPWDSGKPDENLVDAASAAMITPGRTLEIGCGTGTDALWLAARGFAVLGVDVAPLAIERASAKPPAGRCRFEVLDFLASDPPSGPFDVVLDRGCWHVFSSESS